MKFALRSSNMRLILGKQDVDSDATSEICRYRFLPQAERIRDGLF